MSGEENAAPCYADDIPKGSQLACLMQVVYLVSIVTCSPSPVQREDVSARAEVPGAVSMSCDCGPPSLQTPYEL